jgi:tripartite-type tricarboxylate transporter receptor subunit TctC
MKPVSKLAWLPLACAVLAAGPAGADPVADFYKGREIQLIIGYPPGGGYDIYGRLVAKHLGRFIPGSPGVVPQNMPGAGALKAANFLYGAAPKDGTALGIISQSTATEEVLGTPGITYQSKNFNWIGRVTSNVEIEIMWHTAPIKSMADAMVKEAVVGGSGPIAPAEVYPKVLNNVIGTKFKVISGYAGSPESCNAMEKGEVMGCLISWVGLKSGRPDWLRDKQVNIIVQYAIAKHAELPNVPTMVELGKSEEDRQILALYASGADVGRSIMAPPAIPADRVQALRAAFMKMVADARFLDDVKKQNVDLTPLSGEELQRIVRSASDVPPAVVARAKAAHDTK